MRERALIVLSVAGLFLGAFAARTQGVPGPAASGAAAPPAACGSAACTEPCAKPAVAKAGCATDSSCNATPVTLTPEEEKAAGWAVAQILKAGSVERALAGAKPKSFLERGGFDISRLDLERVKAGVDAKLSASGSELSVTRCAAYGACAIGTDLTEATGPLLEKYRKQKSEDGQTYTGRVAPAFRLKDLDGRTVSLSDFKGRRVALVFWQGHCSHSQKSLPIWNTLRKELGGKDFEVVTVLFHGGDAPLVKTWYEPMGLKLPVLLAESDALAEAYGSHLVPSVFLVDENGRLTKKLVTQQTAETLRTELTGFAKRGA